MKKLNILCDVDGVLADMLSEWLRLSNKDWNDNVRPEDIRTWEIHKYVKCGMAIYEYLWRPDLYSNVLPFPGAIDGVKQLREMGHRVIFVTSGLQPAKIEWLHRMGLLDGELWESDPDWIIATDKSLIKGDLLIDDYLKNLRNFTGGKILFDAPHNRVPSPFYRVRNWYTIVKVVRGITSQDSQAL